MGVTRVTERVYSFFFFFSWTVRPERTSFTFDRDKDVSCLLRSVDSVYWPLFGLSFFSAPWCYLFSVSVRPTTGLRVTLTLTPRISTTVSQRVSEQNPVWFRVRGDEMLTPRSGFLCSC